jgi:hypothetical protein
MLRPYSIFAIVDGTIGPFGGFTYKSKAEIKAFVHIQFDSGEDVRPLEDEEISDDV